MGVFHCSVYFNDFKISNPGVKVVGCYQSSPIGCKMASNSEYPNPFSFRGFTVLVVFSKNPDVKNPTNLEFFYHVRGFVKELDNFFKTYLQKTLKNLSFIILF